MKEAQPFLPRRAALVKKAQPFIVGGLIGCSPSSLERLRFYLKSAALRCEGLRLKSATLLKKLRATIERAAVKKRSPKGLF